MSGTRARPGTSEPGPLAGILRRGAAISALTLVLMQGTSLASTLLLARLLSPSEIGAYAAGTVFSGFLTMFAHSGLQSALIQREHDVDNAADTVFWATAASGIVMSLLALAASPVVALLFHSDLAGRIAAITSGMLLLHALTNVPDGLMQRRFNFKRRMIVDPTRGFAYAIAAVGLAAAGFGVYSLVIANYVTLVAWLVSTWSLCRWRPGRGRPSVRLWRQLARFALPLVIQAVVEQARETAEAALLGRRFGEASLGQYRYGKRLMMIPVLAVVEVGAYVLFPAFSRLAGQPERLKAGFLRALRWIWFVSMPMTALIIALGEPAVVVLLGARWRDAGLFLVATAGYGLGAAVEAVSNEGIKACGRSRLLNWTSSMHLVLGIGLVLALLPFGLVGVGLAISITELSVGILALGLTRAVIPFPLAALVRILVPSGLASLVAFAAVWSLEHLLLRSDQHGFGVGIMLLTADSIAFVAVYLAVLCLADRKLVVDLVDAARARAFTQRQRVGLRDQS